MTEYKMLFTPMKIGTCQIKNRTVMTPMGVDLSDCDGTVNEKTIAYYSERAKGDIGLIVSEYCRVNEKDGACATGQLSLSSDKYIPGMKKLADSIHSNGAKFFVQLHHPGRQCIPVFTTYWSKFEFLEKVYPGIWNKFFETVAKAGNIDYTDSANEQAAKELMKKMKPCLAPSIIPENEDDGPMHIVKCRAFTLSEIKTLEQQFINAAKRAQKAGADGVELHAGHGYLFEQFLSPYTNRRTDEYGGSIENRCRILTEIIHGIHDACGSDYPVTVRLTVEEFYELTGHPERGYHIDQGIQMAEQMEKAGADAINVTIAGVNTTNLVTESVRHEPGWRAPYVKQIKDAVSIPIIAVGVIRTPEQAEQLLEDGVQDFIGLGRPTLADPMWVKKAENHQSHSINRCISCLACMDSFMANMLNDKPIECALNPRTCHETEYPVHGTRDGNGRKVIIIGAGPAGLVAARELADRQFHVIVLEKENVPGGQINEADKPCCKDRLIWCVEDYEKQALAAGAEIRYHTAATKELLEKESPYAVLVASGAFASKPPIKGADQEFVYTVTPVLLGQIAPVNQKIVLIGSGMTGLETTEMLVNLGNQVTVVEMADQIAQGATGINITEIKAILNEKKVQFMLSTKLKEIGNHTVTVAGKDGTEAVLDADTVILSLGSKKNDALVKELAGEEFTVQVIGDASKVGRIGDAVRSAFEVARKLS